MSLSLLFFLVLLFLFGLCGFVIWLFARKQCPEPAPGGKRLCMRRMGHAGRHLTMVSSYVEFDAPTTPSGRSCPHHGMSDDDLDDYERHFDVPGRKK